MKYDLLSSLKSEAKKYNELAFKESLGVISGSYISISSGTTYTYTNESDLLSQLFTVLQPYLTTATDFNNKAEQSNVDEISNNINKYNLLYNDSIQGTTQIPTYTGEDITKVEHKETGNLTNIIRTDNFTYTATKITEVRTLSTLETVTLEYNFDVDGNYTDTVVS